VTIVLTDVKILYVVDISFNYFGFSGNDGHVVQSIISIITYAEATGR